MFATSVEKTKNWTLFCLTANLLFSISIVLINKWIYKVIGFPNLTLTFIHFVVTSVGLLIAAKLFKLFKIKRLPFMKMIPLSLTFCGFVVFTNLSLLHNSVGIYQVYKTLTMPLIALIQFYFYKESLSNRVKLCLIPILFGVFLSSFYDLKFSFTGFVYAMLGVVVTSVYQIWVGKRQNELKITSAQLLVYQAPLSALWLLVVIPIFEPPGDELLKSHFTAHDLLFVMISGTIALLINLTIFAIIGNTSPMTYNVFGQLKFALTIIFGFLIFDDELYFLQFIGISLTFFGVALYTITRLREQKQRLPLLPTLQSKKHSDI
ncbi:hypothetical protein B4U80_00227 [Leptotrombidium deliense]|uniref:Sugar phosphate transporter domain-containing protein n=1 Tax=Leptotrombidium deliense TaxID=299467 RepID=A0A443SME3_9ACAR|nr:hypothetical protein B4U80_00227 [Leptotrombidium deliense]